MATTGVQKEAHLEKSTRTQMRFRPYGLSTISSAWQLGAEGIHVCVDTLPSDWGPERVLEYQTSLRVHGHLGSKENKG